MLLHEIKSMLRSLKKADWSNSEVNRPKIVQNSKSLFWFGFLIFFTPCFRFLVVQGTILIPIFEKNQPCGFLHVPADEGPPTSKKRPKIAKIEDESQQ